MNNAQTKKNFSCKKILCQIVDNYQNKPYKISNKITEMKIYYEYSLSHQYVHPP